MPSEKERFREIDENVEKFWDEYWKEHPETRPTGKPPEMEKEAEEWGRLEKQLKEPSAVPDELAMPIIEIKFEGILEKFKGLPDRGRIDRLIILRDTLRLAEMAEEDLAISRDIELYQSGIVNTALKMLTMDNIPRWLATEELKKLKKQISQVFRPSTSPLETGLRYKDPKGMAKLLKVDVEKLLEEWAPFGE